MSAPVNTISAGALPNYIINGAMDYAQRGVGPTSMTGTVRFVLDRWNCYRGADSGNYQITQVAVTTDSVSQGQGLLFALRSQRVSGDTTTQINYVTQDITTSFSQKLRGKPVTLSFFAKLGANFSGTAGLNYALFTGTGTNEAIRTGYTGGSSVSGTATNLSNSAWTRVTLSTTISTTANEIGVQFSWTPTGTAGAADYVDITGVMVNEGGVQPFRLAAPNLVAELQLCQAFYEKSYDISTVPGTNVGGAGTAGIRGTNSSQPFTVAYFKVQKRSFPTIIPYDWAGTANRVRINGVDGQTNYSLFDASTSSFGYSPTTGTNSELFYHWTADCETY